MERGHGKRPFHENARDLQRALSYGDVEGAKTLIERHFDSIRTDFSCLAGRKETGHTPEQIANIVLGPQGLHPSTFEPSPAFYQSKTVDPRLRKTDTPYLELCVLPDWLNRMVVSIPRFRIWFTAPGDNSTMPWIDLFKAFVENFTGSTWLWWPLEPRMKWLKPHQIRVHWICSCGDYAWKEVSIAEAEIMKSILRKRVDFPSESVFCKARNSKEVSMANAKEVKSSSGEDTDTWQIAKNALVDSIRRFIRAGIQDPDRTSSPASPPAYLQGSRSQASQNLPPGNQAAQSIPIDSQHRNQQQILSDQGASQITNPSTTGKLWVLFGTTNLTPTVQLAHVEIDKDEIYGDWNFYLALKKKYQAQRGNLRLWFSCWQLGHCEFVEFSQISRRKTVRRRRALPERGDPAYDCSPQPPQVDVENPPVSEHEFYARLRECGSACEQQDWGRGHVFRIPKRKFPFVWQRGKDPFAFGLQAVYYISWTHVLVYHFLALLLPFVFWFFWQKLHPSDISTASVPASVVIAFISCFWTCVGPLGQIGRV